MWFYQGGPHSECLSSTHGGLSLGGGLSLCQALDGVREWVGRCVGGKGEGNSDTPGKKQHF